MSDEEEQTTSMLSITAPEILKAVAAATGDQGAACRSLRSTSSQLRALLPAAFTQPLIIRLTGHEDAAAAVGQHTVAAAAATADTSATAAPASGPAAAHPSAVAELCEAAFKPLQETQCLHCDWPLLQLWQQYQQQGRPQNMLLPEVQLMLGPNLCWLPGSSSSSSRSSSSSSSSSMDGLPELLLPHCSLLQQQEFLQQMPCLTVTYAQGAAAAEANNSQEQLHQQVDLKGSSSSSSSSGAAGFPASSLAAMLLAHQAPLTSFTLQPRDTLYSSPFWVQATQQMHLSSSSSSGSSWNIPGPCVVICPEHADLHGAAVLGRQWLPHLLLLPQLKRLALPVLWAADEQLQAQQLAALRAELAAAAAAAAVAATASGSHAASTTASDVRSLEVLQLLLVPAGLHLGPVRAADATPAEFGNLAVLPHWSREALQQLLQLLLLQLPGLQHLELTVMGSVQGPRESLNDLAASLSKSCSSLQSFSFYELLWSKFQMRPRGDQRGSLDVQGMTWDCRSNCSITALQEVQVLASSQQQQQQLLQQPGQGQLRALALKYRGKPADMPPLSAGLLSGVTQLQLAVPQTLLPHLASLLPEDQGSSSSSLWQQLQALTLCLHEGGMELVDYPALRPWPVPAHSEQQSTMRRLLRSSSSLRVLRMQSSIRGGVTLLPSLAPIATAASGSLQELQLISAVPALHTTGYLPVLHEFTQLRSLTLAYPALRRTALMLQLLPPTLQQLHLHDFPISCPLAAAGELPEAYSTQQQHAAQPTEDTSQQFAPPAAAEAGEDPAALTHAEDAEMRGQAVPRAVAWMLQLQRLHLIGCSAAAIDISLPLLLQWAGPCLQEVVLAYISLEPGRPAAPSTQFAAAAAAAAAAAVLLPRLRRFDWVDCRLPMVPGGSPIGRSQLLAFLQAVAPQLQQLKVAAGQTRPLLDWHVPLLLRMTQLRRLEVYVGPDPAGELAARLQQQQQQQQQQRQAGASAAAGATMLPQLLPQEQQQQQQRSEVMAAMQGMQQQLLQLQLSDDEAAMQGMQMLLQQQALLQQQQQQALLQQQQQQFAAAMQVVQQQALHLQLSHLVDAMHGMQQHLVQAARYARQVQRLTSSHIAAISEGGAAAGMHNAAIDEVVQQSQKDVGNLLVNESLNALVGMSAAAVAALQQGLAAGSCAALVLHNKWAAVGVGESVNIR
uniref:Uncharacterized protein n=1 Tax=Tetradesmus obliquus TaxID=3088 RepID=A0A383WQE1_TETOB|eukprot:jgi/Sobl393_1/4589/SZX79216.1